MKITKRQLRRILKEEWYSDEHETLADKKFADSIADSSYNSMSPRGKSIANAAKRQFAKDYPDVQVGIDGRGGWITVNGKKAVNMSKASGAPLSMEDIIDRMKKSYLGYPVLSRYNESNSFSNAAYDAGVHDAKTGLDPDWDRYDNDPDYAYGYDSYDPLEEADGFTKKYDNDSALKGAQSKLPDGLQKGIIDKAIEDREGRKKQKNEGRVMQITKEKLKKIISEEFRRLTVLHESSRFEPVTADPRSFDQYWLAVDRAYNLSMNGAEKEDWRDAYNAGWRFVNDRQNHSWLSPQELPWDYEDPYDPEAMPDPMDSAIRDMTAFDPDDHR